MNQKITILVVDDEIRMCKSLQVLLEENEYIVRLATSGEEALQILKDSYCDICLVDIGMPQMDGCQLLEHIASSHPQTIVIMMTGNASVDSAVSCLKKGAYDYLRKPFEIEDLTKAIENALEIKRLKDENRDILVRLRRSELKYREMVQNSPDIIYRLDCQGKFTFLNSTVERLLGIKVEELIGQHYECIIHPEDRKKARGIFNNIHKDNGNSSSYELKLQCANNGKIKLKSNHIIVELRASGIYCLDPETHQNRCIGTYGVARDISYRHHLEERLRQTHKMEAIGTLAGGIAHDFNNLLMGIQGYTSLMLVDLAPDQPHIKDLKNIEQLVESGAQLTQQLLGFARGGKYDVKVVDIRDLIVKSLSMFGRTKKELNIHTKLSADLWNIKADVSQINQVFLNLYLNAWQAMPYGGDLTVRASNTTLDKDTSSKLGLGLEAGKYVKISVTDSGIGIEKELQQRIFEPFFSTKERGRGTGMGLASAFGIVVNHGGVIKVASIKYKGSTFCMYLPATDVETPNEKKHASIICSGKETILLVDDEETVIEVTKQMLACIGYEVITAKCGLEAIDILKKSEKEIDLLILDMIMPDMSGGLTFDRIKQIKPDLKVILSSGYSIKGEARKIMERGCNGFIQKPFKIAELSKKIKEVIREENLKKQIQGMTSDVSVTLVRP